MERKYEIIEETEYRILISYRGTVFSHIKNDDVSIDKILESFDLGIDAAEEFREHHLNKPEPLPEHQQEVVDSIHLKLKKRRNRSN